MRDLFPCFKCGGIGERFVNVADEPLPICNPCWEEPFVLPSFRLAISGARESREIRLERVES